MNRDITILEGPEKAQFSDFLAKITTEIILESVRSIKDASDFKPGMKIDKEFTIAAGGVLSQVTYDKVLELTKDMPKELMVKFMSEMATSCALESVNKMPEEVKKIAVMTAMWALNGKK